MAYVTEEASIILGFVKTAVLALVNHPENVALNLAQDGRNITIGVNCHPGDLRFIEAKSRPIIAIAIGIAQKNKVYIRLLFDDAKMGSGAR